MSGIFDELLESKISREMSKSQGDSQIEDRC